MSLESTEILNQIKQVIGSQSHELGKRFSRLELTVENRIEDISDEEKFVI